MSPLAVQRACARVVAMTPTPGGRDESSGAEPSRHGELIDSQHCSQEYSQQGVFCAGCRRSEV